MIEFLKSFVIAAFWIGLSIVIVLAWLRGVTALSDMHPLWSIGLLFGGIVFMAALGVAIFKHAPE